MDRKEQLMKIFSRSYQGNIDGIAGAYRQTSGNPAAGGQAFDDFI